MGSWEIGSWGRRVGRGWELVVGGSCWGAGSWELLGSRRGHASRFRVKVMEFQNFKVIIKSCGWEGRLGRGWGAGERALGAGELGERVGRGWKTNSLRGELSWGAE